MVGSRNAMIYRTSLAEIRTLGRIAQGVKIMTKLADDDVVISMSAFRERTWEDFEKLPKVEPRKARAASTNGHASAATLDDAAGDPQPEAEEASEDEASEAVLDAEETSETNEDTDPVDDADDAGEGASGDTTVSMWHAMQAPLFPEPDEPKDEEGA